MKNYATPMSGARRGVMAKPKASKIEKALKIVFAARVEILKLGLSNEELFKLLALLQGELWAGLNKEVSDVR